MCQSHKEKAHLAKMKLASDSMIRNYLKLLLETLSNLPILRLTEKNKFEKLFTEMI